MALGAGSVFGVEVCGHRPVATGTLFFMLFQFMATGAAHLLAPQMHGLLQRNSVPLLGAGHGMAFGAARFQAGMVTHAAGFRVPLVRFVIKRYGSHPSGAPRLIPLRCRHAHEDHVRLFALHAGDVRYPLQGLLFRSRAEFALGRCLQAVRRLEPP